MDATSMESLVPKTICDQSEMKKEDEVVAKKISYKQLTQRSKNKLIVKFIDAIKSYLTWLLISSARD